MTEDRALKCLDDLISILGTRLKENESHKYYFEVFLPAVVRGQSTLTPREAAVLQNLKKVLSEDEWASLPDLYLSRVNGKDLALSLDVATRREYYDSLRKREEEIRREEEEAQRRSELVLEIRQQCEDDFLGVRAFVKAHADGQLLDEGEIEAVLADYAAEWADRTLGLKLDRDQAAAVAATEDDVLVTARAGSGKTRALVTRAIFLQSHCRVPPSEILLLAFNRQAVEEIRERLREHLGEELPHVMTFHALAHALVHPAETLVYDDEDVGYQGQSRLMQEAVDQLVRAPESGEMVRNIMIAQFREDWDKIVLGGHDLDREEMLELRRSLTHESLDGEYVKSYGERLIANTLFEHDIEYEYERNHFWDGINYRPDFSINTETDAGVVLEYFGLKGDPDYDEQSAAKRRYWEQKEGWTLIERSPGDVASTTSTEFAARLIGELERLGVPARQLSDEEIWERIRHRAIDQFTGAVVTFLRRARKQGLDSNSLRHQISLHEPVSDGERLFLDAMPDLFEGYLNELTATGSDDFDGLLWRAIKQLQEGHTEFARDKGNERGNTRLLRYLLVDEFQDFSEAFLQMTLAIRQLTDNAGLFCVGDPWQAINRFAGSDPKYFEYFEQIVGQCRRLEIPTNYRSSPEIVATGNAVMAGSGTPSQPSVSTEGNVRIYFLDEFTPRIAEERNYPGSTIIPATLRVVKKALQGHESVTLLSRRKNGLPGHAGWRADKFLQVVRSHFPGEKERIKASTVHKYKGREDDCVVLLDAVDRSFPLIHPSWIYQRLFGDELHRLADDERRLFYVAVTRSRSSLIVISDSKKTTPFLKQVRGGGMATKGKWQGLESVSTRSGQTFELRASNGYEYRELLKNDGFRWHDRGKYWRRLVDEKYISDKLWRAASWFREPVQLDVMDGEGRSIERQTA